MRRRVTEISFLLILSALLCAAAAGCSKSNDDIEEAETIVIEVAETEEETEEETQEDDGLEEGQMYSFYTGEVVDTSIGMLRPIAIMINNIESATAQQCGTSQADILYEAVVEGGITRLLAIVQDTTNLEKIGSVRSARHNYIDFAYNFDAIFCHYGQSIYATQRIAEDNLLTVSENVSVAYFKDSNYSSPHNVFASGETLEDGIESIGAERYLDDDYESSLLFYTEDTELSYGTIANYVEIPFALSQPTLTYNSETGLYEKTQYGEAHIDANTGEQLTFKNIIVQYAKYETIEGGSGCQDITLTGEGKAVYITNGKAVTITWVRESSSDITRYYYEDGTQVSLNPGKTYIAVVPTSYDEITLSE